MRWEARAAILLAIVHGYLECRPAHADDRSTDRIVRALEKIADNIGKCR